MAIRRYEYPNVAIEYDPEAKAAYIYLKEGEGPEDYAFPVPGIILDLKDGEVVGIEVLF